MISISDIFLNLTSYAVVFLGGEFILWLSLIHDKAGWHFRFGSIDGYPQLRPTISTLRVTFILFAMVIFISPFILPSIWNKVIVDLVKVSELPALLFIGSVLFTFFWIWHFVVGKDWNLQQTTLLVLSLVILGIYFGINLFS